MDTNKPDRVDLFDAWAERYDRSVASDSFPFAGYDEVLSMLVRLAGVEPGHLVLDIGIGTGNLAARLASPTTELWGVDFSHEMLEQCRVKLPSAHLVQADLLQGLPRDLPTQFDRIVSGYVFHEFPDSEKLRLIENLAACLAPDGRILIGDIAFETEEAMQECRRNWKNAWDEAEHYWVAKSLLPLIEARGFVAEYEQLSFCGGVFSLRKMIPT